MLRLTDLREILRYVPRFRDKLFVIALDGAVVDHENFPNLLLDIALLRSLSVRLLLVHGAAHQLARLAGIAGVEPTDLDGTAPVDNRTLQVAITAANRVTHEILEGLAANDLRAACPNALTANPAGILGGVDHQFLGRIDKVDVVLLQTLLERDIIPVLPPLGVDGAGRSYRLNSDAVAVEVAKALGAVKLVYLSTEGGVSGPKGVMRQLTVEEADDVLRRHKADLSKPAVTKLTHAVRAGRGGVERIHIIDGREQEGLLGEVFSNEGIGTLVYANEYQAIRPAAKRDVRAVWTLVQRGMQADELVRRTREEVARHIADYFVFEVDRNPVGCVCLTPYPGADKAELASVYVDPRYENQGIGGKLIQYAESVARSRGVGTLFCLSTQAVNYFIQKGGFALGTPDDLPPGRREQYDRNGRKSAVLVKPLAADPQA
jgi:amino-acid N-acetyltransferase